MSEHEFNLMYVSMGVVVAIVSGIAFSVWAIVFDDAEPHVASSFGGIVGTVCGVLWPLAIGASIVASVAYVACRITASVMKRIKGENYGR